MSSSLIDNVHHTIITYESPPATLSLSSESRTEWVDENIISPPYSKPTIKYSPYCSWNSSTLSPGNISRVLCPIFSHHHRLQTKHHHSVYSLFECIESALRSQCWLCGSIGISWHLVSRHIYWAKTQHSLHEIPRRRYMYIKRKKCIFIYDMRTIIICTFIPYDDPSICMFCVFFWISIWDFVSMCDGLCFDWLMCLFVSIVFEWNGYWSFEFLCVCWPIFWFRWRFLVFWPCVCSRSYTLCVYHHS